MLYNTRDLETPSSSSGKNRVVKSKETHFRGSVYLLDPKEQLTTPLSKSWELKKTPLDWAEIDIFIFSKQIPLTLLPLLQVNQTRWKPGEEQWIMLILMNPKRSKKSSCVVGKPGHTDLLKRCRLFTDTLLKFKHQNDLHYTDWNTAEAW